jgi:hypothetical protein
MSVEKETELRKLFHLLNDDSGQKLGFLENLEFQQLEILRLKIQEQAHAEQAQLWRKLSKVANFMPNFVNAKVAEQVLGASITANISYYMEVKDAVSIMKFLSLPFMAEVAHHMIPDKSVNLLNQLPLDLMKKLVHYLLKKQEHFVVGSFVEVTERYRVLEISKTIESESDLVKISLYVKDRSSLTDVYRSFPDYRKIKLFKEAHRLNAFHVIASMAQNMKNYEVEQLSTLLFKESPAMLQAFVDASSAHFSASE